MTELYGTKEAKEISNENAEKLLDAIYDERVMKVSVVTEEIDEKDIEDDVKLIKKKISSESKIANYYNVEILVEIEGQEEIEKVTKLTEKIKISIPIPSDLPEVKDGYEREYSVIRVHNGVADELQATAEGTAVIVSSDEFSTYALTYKDVEKPVEEEITKSDDEKTSESEEKTSEETTTEDNTQNDTQKENKISEDKKTRNVKSTNNPKTGDNILLWVALFVISGLSFVVNVKWNRKRLTGKH